MTGSIVRRVAVQALALIVGVVSVAVGPAGLALGGERATGQAWPGRPELVGRLDAARVELAPGGSEARYRSQEVLAARGNNEAIGRTSDVSGSILFDADGAVRAEQSRVTVDLRTLQSDNSMRDNYIKRTTLQVSEYPLAELVVRAAPGLPFPLPTSGAATFELVGDLTVHGVTRPTTWQTTVTFAEGEVVGFATTTVLMTDFGMTPPRVGSVLSIEDAVVLELDVRAVVIAPAAALRRPSGPEPGAAGS